VLISQYMKVLINTFFGLNVIQIVTVYMKYFHYIHVK